MFARRYSGYIRLGLLLAAVAAAVVLLLFREETPAEDWLCYPVNPASKLPPLAPACFRASLSDTNLVTLEWRASPSTRSLYLYDDTAPGYRDIGAVPAVCDSGPLGGCAVSFRIGKGGFFNWKLRATAGGDQVTHVATALEVGVDKTPYPPMRVEVDNAGFFVDMLAPGPRRFSWEVDPRNAFPADTDRAWIEVNEPDSFFWNTARYPRTGPDAHFVAPTSAFLARGSVLYQVRDCHLPPGSDKKFCSDPLLVGFRVGHDHFVGEHNTHVESGKDLTLSFTTVSGNVRVLTSDTLLDPASGASFVTTTGSTYVIDGARLTPGRHRIELVSCKLPEWRCSNREDAEPSPMDGSALHMPAGYYQRGEVIAVIVSADRRSMHAIRAPTGGEVHFPVEQAYHEISENEPVAYMLNRGRDVMDIEVDSPVAWEKGRDYTWDFSPAETFATTGPGQALDIAFDESGGIWQTNEFSNNIGYLAPGGDKAFSWTVPLGRNPDSEPRPNAAVKPFTFWWNTRQQGSSTISSLSERVTVSGSKIWFTQGGGLGLYDKPRGPNHSRVISFDRAGQDVPSTRYDDRFCVYNVPADDGDGHGNNQVIGLTSAAGRIWVAESRGLLNEAASYISSFIPNPEQCENLLNFDDPDALREQSLQYCGEGRTPEQDGCVEKTPISSPARYTMSAQLKRVYTGFPRHVKVAHLHADPDEGIIWFNDACGKCLGSLDPAAGGQLTIYSINDQHDEHLEGMQGLGGFPWNLEVDDSAVYSGEYATRHILRLDKTRGTYSEIRVPYDNPDVRLHSLAIDRLRERLWFTLTNETTAPINPAASTIGYVDLASWRNHVEDPVYNPTIRGVLYRGLDQVPPEGGRPAIHQAFRGIAVDQASGRVALATMFREQITVLKPLPGFWP